MVPAETGAALVVLPAVAAVGAAPVGEVVVETIDRMRVPERLGADTRVGSPKRTWGVTGES